MSLAKWVQTTSSCLCMCMISLKLFINTPQHVHPKLVATFANSRHAPCHEPLACVMFIDVTWRGVLCIHLHRVHGLKLGEALSLVSHSGLCTLCVCVVEVVEEVGHVEWM